MSHAINRSDGVPTMLQEIEGSCSTGHQIGCGVLRDALAGEDVEGGANFDVMGRGADGILTKHVLPLRHDEQRFHPPTNASLMQQIIKLPKIDLHRHLTGSITPQMAVRIAAQHNVAMPSYIAAELQAQLFSEERVKTHKEYFRPWPILNQLLLSLDAVHDVILSVVREAAQDNVIYMELRLGPWGFIGEGQYSFDEFANTVSAAIDEAEERFGTVARFVLGVPRHVFARIPTRSRNRMFESMLATVQTIPKCFVGVDLNGDELGANAADFATFFQVAYEMDIPSTVHAGEVSKRAEDVQYAIRTLHASRIGHGIAAAACPSTLSLLAERNCVLELCPTSNCFLGVVEAIKDLPLPTLENYQVPYVLCTDNPARCCVTLSEELFKVAQAFSYSVDKIRALSASALRFSFLDNHTKSMIARRLKTH